MDTRSRILEDIKNEHTVKLKQVGGKNFLKHELQASDVRLNCFDGLKLVSKTKKYLSGKQKAALLQHDEKAKFVLSEQESMKQAE